MLYLKAKGEAEMGEFLEQVPQAIRAHLAGLARHSGLPEGEATLEQLARAWLEKKRMFEEQIRALDMLEVDSLAAADGRGALLLTTSASLVGVGAARPSAEPTEKAAGRRLEYASIQLRTDVPHLLVEDDAALEGDLVLGREARFGGGSIHSTSPLLKIAVCDAGVSAEEQEKRLREAAIFLTGGFLRINRTIALPDGVPEQFSSRNLVAYLARKNSLAQKAVRALLEDYHLLLESGLLQGGRVRLGRLGTLHLRLLPARKARVGLNPATGQPLTIPARPRQAAPRFAFSRLLKERARQLPPPPEQPVS
jgi:nucleoid DNA-binding protein